MEEHDGRLGDDQTATLVQAVGGASRARVPLEVTLAALGDAKEDRQLSDIAQRLAAQLEQGRSVDQALAQLDRHLPEEFRGLLRAGIESGDLAGTFERFADQRLAAQRIARRIHAAIAYPLLIMAILVPLLLFISMYVIPMFGELYEDFAVELPALTLLVLQSAKQVPVLIAGLALFTVGFPLLLRSFGGRWLFHRVRSATPLLGRLWMWSSQREFAALLASFLDLRLPMTKAVAHTGEVMSDRNVAGACRRVSERLESGESLSESLGQSIHFDRSLVALVAWGERHGLLPEALRISTEVFDDRIEQWASLIQRLLPPVTLIVVGVLMFAIIISLMLPLVTLMEMLS